MSIRLLFALILCSQTAGWLLPPTSKLDATPSTSSRRAILSSAAAATLLGLPVVATAADSVLHIVDYPKKGACGEALVPEKGVPFVKTFGGMSDGGCAAAGYPNKEGSANGTGDKDKDRTYDIYTK